MQVELETIEGTSRYAQRTVYKVGVEQYERFCKDNPFVGLADAGVGACVVVTTWSEFGKSMSFVYSSNVMSLDDALRFAGGLEHNDMAAIAMGISRSAHEYEVWQLVPDDYLWGNWNARVEDAKVCEAFRGAAESQADDAPHDDVIDYGEDMSKAISVDMSNMALAQSVNEEYGALTGIEREFSYFVVECDSYMEEQACKLEFLLPDDAVLCAVAMAQSTFVPSVTIKLFVCCERVERGTWEVFPYVPTV